MQILTRIVEYGRILHLRIQVVDQHTQTDMPAPHGLQTQQGVVHAAQFARSHKDNGIVLLHDVVNGQHILRQGDHQSARTFKQHTVVTLAQLTGSVLDMLKIDGTVVQL